LVTDQNLIVKTNFATVPDEIKELWGRPPILPSEESGIYCRLAAELATAIQPSDIIEWFWVKDLLDHSWDIRRLRRLKAVVIGHREDYPGGPPYFRSGGDVTDKEAREAKAFVIHSKVLEQLERMMALTEIRRNKVLNEIECRRVNLAAAARIASDNIIEGEVIESPRPANAA
jgi:hypothetical protein